MRISNNLSQDNFEVRVELLCMECVKIDEIIKKVPIMIILCLLVVASKW